MNKRASTRILVTSVGGLIVPSLLRQWRASRRFAHRFVGVDLNPHALGRHYVDDFHAVPAARSRGYVPAMADLCRRLKITHLLPFSDPEAAALAQAEPLWAKLGVTRIGPGAKAVVTCVNKGRMLTALRRAAVPVPEFHVPRNARETMAAARELGFPEVPVVVKPVEGFGSRGFRILTPGFSEFGEVFEQKREMRISPERLKRLLDEREAAGRPLHLMVMRYLEGRDFNLDVLCREGEVVHCVAQDRLAPRHGPVERGQVDPDPRLLEAARHVVKALGLHCLVNIEMALPHANNAGMPLVYEVNPRPSAAIIAAERAGVPMLDDALRVLRGDAVRPRAPRRLTMTRFWQERFDFSDA